MTPPCWLTVTLDSPLSHPHLWLDGSVFRIHPESEPPHCLLCPHHRLRLGPCRSLPVLPSSAGTPAAYSQHSSQSILLERPQALSLLSPSPHRLPSSCTALPRTRRPHAAALWPRPPRFSDLGTLLALRWLFLLSEKLSPRDLHSVPNSAVTVTPSQ